MFTNINTRSEFEKYLGSTPSEPEGDARALVDKLDIVRYIGGEYVALRDLMVHEKALHLVISGMAERTLYCSPSELKELIVGHLYTQGYIRSLDDILSLELDEEAGCAVAQVKPGEHAASGEPPCDTCVFDPKILLANQQRFYDNSTLQKATAGTRLHSVPPEYRRSVPENRTTRGEPYTADAADHPHPHSADRNAPAD